MSQQEPRLPPDRPVRSTASTTIGQFLVFTGPIVFAGGFLAIWRTGERNWFYMALGVIGLAVWGVGAVLLWRKQSK